VLARAEGVTSRYVFYAFASVMPRSAKNGSNSPCSNISLTMSQPPTNSPSHKSCGMVGQLEIP